MSVSKHSLEIAEMEKENAQLRACLERAGWGPCNIPACNCNGWHHLRPSRYEQEMIDEATAAKQREVERLQEKERTYAQLNDDYNLLRNQLRAATAAFHSAVEERTATAKENDELHEQLEQWKDARQDIPWLLEQLEDARNALTMTGDAYNELENELARLKSQLADALKVTTEATLKHVVNVQR